jgi:hypothetical protein
MPEIRTEHLFDMELELGGFHFIGKTPYGDRRVGFVKGGTFSGPRLRGVIHGGSDWLLVRGDGATQLDVRLVMETDDGAKFCAMYPGLRVGSQEVLDRHVAGDVVDASEYYFRTALRFETGSEKYDWLNHVLALGIGFRSATGPSYKVYQIA